jgi:NAD(P)-dependent dehydrogenase (short-subunit alcohol dehydrogenase family)
MPSSPQKIALVTGAGSGIGKASAIALAKAGFTLVLVGRRPDPLDAVAKEIGGQTMVVPANVGDPEAVKSLFARIKRSFDRLDLLFNNAGTFVPAASIEDITLDQWRNAVAVNISAAFFCTQEAVRMMKAQTPRGGRIINNGSISAHAPRLHSAAYTTTKHAITGLTKSTALDGRRYDIACGQIDIGNAASDMTDRMSSGVLQADGSTKAEAVMAVKNVAEAVVYMARLPLDANVLTMTVMATKMPFVGRG